MKERRLARLQAQIQHRIAEVLLRDLQDPKLGLVTVTRVELDKEFTICRCFWSVLGDHKQRQRSEHALQRARGYVQREVGAVLATRTVPHLEFVHDERIEGAIKMQQLIADVKQEREAAEKARGEAPAAGEPSPKPAADD